MGMKWMWNPIVAPSRPVHPAPLLEGWRLWLALAVIALAGALSLLRGKSRQWGGSRNEKHAPAWTAIDLRFLVKSLGSAVRQTRTDGGNAALIAERALVVLGQAARARRR